MVSFGEHGYCHACRGTSGPGGSSLQGVEALELQPVAIPQLPALEPMYQLVRLHQGEGFHITYNLIF